MEEYRRARKDVTECVASSRVYNDSPLSSWSKVTVGILPWRLTLCSAPSDADVAAAAADNDDGDKAFVKADFDSIGSHNDDCKDNVELLKDCEFLSCVMAGVSATANDDDEDVGGDNELTSEELCSTDSEFDADTDVDIEETGVTLTDGVDVSDTIPDVTADEWRDSAKSSVDEYISSVHSVSTEP